MTYAKTFKPSNGSSALQKTIMVDGEGNEVSVAKGEARNSIEALGIDTLDSLADTSKMISIGLSFIATIYEVLTDEQKNAIPAEKRALIEFGINAFKETNTWADLQLANEGTAMITRILERQKHIALAVAAANGLS